VINLFSSKRKRTKDKLGIVFDAQLIRLLKEKENIEDPESAEYKCLVCGRTITFDEIGGIKIRNGRIKVICRECL